MIRLDKFLCDMGVGTRSEVKNFIKKGQVSIDGTVVKQPDLKLDETNSTVYFQGRSYSYVKYGYFMLNKPAGVVSSTKDNVSDTVLQLLGNPGMKNLFPVGRLDKDTEGLLLISNDGMLAHELLSPKKHVDKTYYVEVDKPLSLEDMEKLEQGVDIGDDKPTLPAKIVKVNDLTYHLTIHEGRFHQVKRMMEAVGSHVTYLKRISMGPLTLDDSLKTGEFRPLTQEEVEALIHRSMNSQTSTDFSKMPNIHKPTLDGVEAVIFDLDGSLVDSMWIWKDIDIAYLGNLGIPCPDDIQAAIEGMSFSETAVYFKERFSIPHSLDEIKATWNQMARDKYLHEVPFKQGIPEFLNICKNKGIKLGIATSNSRELVESIANVHGLDDYFSCIMTACEVAKGKPAPDIYLAVAERLGVNPAKCLVFEDIVPGIMAGKNAGMKVCAVEDEYSVYQRAEKEKAADYYIDDFRGIV
ncbi:MAG: pseudouridine synthase [Lachnospiraceae bacterium]|nr:pseudouridine synthase [Lachnospiraceae bacterium]